MDPLQIAAHLIQVVPDPPQIAPNSLQFIDDLRQLAASASQFVMDQAQFAVKSRHFVLRSLGLFGDGFMLPGPSLLETGGKLGQGQSVVGIEGFVKQSSLFFTAGFLGNNGVIRTYTAQHIKKTNPHAPILQQRGFLQSKPLDSGKSRMLANET